LKKNKNKILKIEYIKKDRILKLFFEDGFISSITSELLRVYSPSAETTGHTGQSPPPLVLDKQNVNIIYIEHIGNYAIKLHFDDLHNTGIYSWKYLRYLVENSDLLKKNYKKKLAEIGKS